MTTVWKWFAGDDIERMTGPFETRREAIIKGSGDDDYFIVEALIDPEERDGDGFTPFMETRNEEQFLYAEEHDEIDAERSDDVVEEDGSITLSAPGLGHGHGMWCRDQNEIERWDRIDELRKAVVATLREIDGPEADIEVKWREVRLRRDGHLVCCIPTPLFEGVDGEKIPEIVRSYLEAFDCGRSSTEPSVPFQIDREPVDPELEALRQKKIDEIEALDRAAASSHVSCEIPEEYRWDVGDPSRGPLGEAGPGKA